MADLRSELREIIQDDSRIVTEGIEKKYLSDTSNGSGARQMH